MKASVVDLRYKTRDILKALARNEPVIIFYHNQKKGVIMPVNENKNQEKKVQEHPFFGLFKSKESVEKVMKKLRGGRYRAV